MESIRLTPRVDFSTYQSYQGSNVKLVGTVTQCHGGRAVIQTCDKGEIQVNLLPDSKCIEAAGNPNAAVEVLGMVESDGSISELVSDLLPGAYTPEIYANVIRLMKEYPALYGQ